MMIYNKLSSLLTMLLILHGNFIDAQKPLVDTNAYATWKHAGSPALSNNGKYASFSITAGVWPLPEKLEKFVIKSTDDNWSLELPNLKEHPRFTEDSKFLIGKLEDNSLAIFTLGTSKTEYIQQVGEFKVPDDGDGQWVAYKTITAPTELIVRNLKTDKRIEYRNVSDYEFIRKGRSLRLITKESNDIESVEIIDLTTNRHFKIFSGTAIGRFVYDRNDAGFAFMAKPASEKELSVWYYQFGSDKAKPVANDYSPGVEKKLTIDGINHFSNIGSRLFIRLQEKKEVLTPSKDAVNLNVWHYRDEKLQSQQLLNSGLAEYVGIVDLNTGKVSRLTQDNEYLDLGQYASLGKGNDEWGLIQRMTFQPNVEFNVKYEYFLQSTTNDRRIKIDHKSYISPEGKYLIYFDTAMNCYFSYEIKTRLVRNISSSIKSVDWSPYPYSDYVIQRGIAGWLKNDAAVLIYDRNDIWQLDPAAQKAPVNVTRGYGRQNNIRFNITQQEYPHVPEPFNANEQLVLVAFNKKTKDNGFYRIRLGKNAVPELLTMGPYTYHIYDLTNEAGGSAGADPLKAKYAEAYIVHRQSARESINFFFTKDLKQFLPLSAVYPEKNYNWYTTELHTWKTAEDVELQGVLYKPDNLDTTKKYPVIFYFYNSLSDDLNLYLPPMPSGGALNISWFVSQGYLVFTPDLFFRRGEWSKSAVMALESAAKHLSALPYVNSKKLGIQGSSHGGDMVFDVAANSKLFAAACSVTGSANLITQYQSIGNSGEVFEFSVREIPGNLWQSLDKYIKNSAVFQADRTTTPMLIMNGRKDDRFRLSLEMFLDLRRLGKPAWFLDYEESGHGPTNYRDMVDFSTRMMQFFDHYLRDKPAPVWMTKGIPAKLKGIENGLDLDEASAVADTHGIKFEEGLSWQDIKAKARRENKYIFVDAHATWCGPCKVMASEIFPQSSVGEVINKNFISVKVQMDQTAKDNEIVRGWYNDAKQIANDANLTAYPTLLFFSPEGRLVHKSIGYKNAEGLAAEAENAMDSSTQYFTLIDKAKKGRLDTGQIKTIALRAKEVGDIESSIAVAQRYIRKIPEKSIYTRENLFFISQFLEGSNDRNFNIFLKSSKRVNAIMGKNFAEYTVMGIIGKEEIAPFEKMENADWNAIEKRVAAKYGGLGKERVFAQALVYYMDAKDWINFGKYYKKYFELAVLNDRSYLHINNISWNVVEHVTDTAVLETAVNTMKYDIERFDGNDYPSIDTYANLLYKIGRREEAIQWEEKAVRLSNNDKSYVQTLEKMKNNQPTW